MKTRLSYPNDWPSLYQLSYVGSRKEVVYKYIGRRVSQYNIIDLNITQVQEGCHQFTAQCGVLQITIPFLIGVGALDRYIDTYNLL